MIIVFIQIGVHLSPLSGNEKATYKELVTTKHFSCWQIAEKLFCKQSFHFKV